MSKPVAVVQTSSIVTIPASVSKVITGVNVAGIVNSVLPSGMSPDVIIKPRDISMSHETARAAIGAKASPKAVIVGLSYLTLAYAYGQGKPDVLTKGCPAWAAHGLGLACDYFKAGAGNVTIDALSTAVQSAVDKLLTLPKPIKATSTSVVNVPVLASKVDDTLTDTQIDRINLSADIADKRADDSLILATWAHVDAMMDAENKAKLTAEVQKQAEGVDVVRVIAEMSDKEQAVTLIRAMAAHFGFTLVNMDLPARIAA